MKASGNIAQYCIFSTAWGDAGIAWNSRGVCNVVLPGLGKKQIERLILKDYNTASPGSIKNVKNEVGKIRSYFAGENTDLKARVDLSWATPFQKKVYRAMMRIPYGRTRSYAEVAEMAGSPGACRAVGSANAINRIPLIIPCHRAIRSDGSPGGFSGPGGVKMKKRLLDLESAR